MTTHYNVQFSDLNYEAQEAILEDIVEKLWTQALVEGRELLVDAVVKTWQEAYCRAYDICRILWEGEQPTDEEWEEYLREELSRRAEMIAHKYFKHTEIEVVI